MPGLTRAGFPRDHHVEAALSNLHHRLLPASPDGRMPNTRTFKLSASRAHTKASHKRARGKAPSCTPTRSRRLRALHMHNNALVIRKPPDAMASKQHGHSKAAWTSTHSARAGEHEGLSESLVGKVWLRAMQEQEIHVWMPWKRKDR